MPKLRAQKYHLTDGSSKVNCYNLSIKKTEAIAAGFTISDNLSVKAEPGRIIIEKTDRNE